MADIAATFHWSAAELGAMSPAELARWREQARRRSAAAAGERPRG